MADKYRNLLQVTNLIKVRFWRLDWKKRMVINFIYESIFGVMKKISILGFGKAVILLLSVMVW